MRVGRRLVDGAARQLVGERGEGDGQVDGAPEGLAHGALRLPGICGGGEHVFAKVGGGSDGRLACAPPGRDLAPGLGIRSEILHPILHPRVR
jgi:hypothetical protein